MQQIDFMNLADHKYLSLVEKQPKPSFWLIFADVICLHVAFTNSPNIETNKSTQNAKFDIGNGTKLPSNKLCV